MPKREIGLHELIVKMRQYADYLRAEEPNIAPLDAYQKAVAQIFMVAAESLDVSPFEARVLDVLDKLSPHNDVPPAATKRLAAHLGISDWSAWNYLSGLEKRGLVNRPQGSRSGWKVA